MPDTRPGIKFDSNGTCHACLNFQKQKTTDWEQRFNELKELAFENIGGIQGISPGGWKHKRELLRLLQLEPQFFNQEVQ